MILPVLPLRSHRLLLLGSERVCLVRSGRSLTVAALFFALTRRRQNAHLRGQGHPATELMDAIIHCLQLTPEPLDSHRRARVRRRRIRQQLQHAVPRRRGLVAVFTESGGELREVWLL